MQLTLKGPKDLWTVKTGLIDQHKYNIKKIIQIGRIAGALSRMPTKRHLIYFSEKVTTKFLSRTERKRYKINKSFLFKGKKTFFLPKIQGPSLILSQIVLYIFLINDAINKEKSEARKVA